MFIFKSSIARQRINIRHYVYCLAVLHTLSCPVACRREFVARPILPALSLHALSTLALFACRFHYLRNPYPENDHYPQFHYTRIKSPQIKPYLFDWKLCFYCLHNNRDNVSTTSTAATKLVSKWIRKKASK